jgi:hypothetical protein
MKDFLKLPCPHRWHFVKMYFDYEKQKEVAIFVCDDCGLIKKVITHD